MGKDPGDGHGVGEERDEGEGGATGGADQREGLVDSGQEGGPRGGSGGACIGGLGRWVVGHRGFREREIWNGIGDGVGMVLVGASRDEGPQGGIGCERPVVTMTMNPGRGKEGGETKPTAVIPAEHILGFVGLEEAMATKMAEDSFAYRVLESLQELGGEIGGFVEMEAVGRGFVVPVSIGSLELRPGEGLAPGVP